MKVLKNVGLKSLLAMILLFTVHSLFASVVEPGIIIKKHQEKSFLLYLNFAQKKDFKITLKDANRITLWKENQQASQHFSKKINLMNLPDGTYFLEVEDEQTLTICEVLIEEDVLSIAKEKRVQFFKPVIAQEAQSILFNLFLPNPKDAEITIFDAERNVVYQEFFVKQQKIERAFDFSQAEPGNYVLQTKTKGRIFENYIRL